MNPLKNTRLIDIFCSLVFMGSLWQLEIAKLNTCNGWRFAYLFCLVTVDNWAASDFFFLLAILSFIGVALNGRFAKEK